MMLSQIFEKFLKTKEFNVTSRDVLKFVLLLQLLANFSIFLDYMGLNILGLRQITWFIYLSFTPGILMLGVVNMYKCNLSLTEIMVYSIGLSISILMFIGASINIFCPLVGISKPISLIPLIITINVTMIFLCLIFQLRNKVSYTILNVKLPKKYINYILFLLLLPYLSILGAYALTFYNNNFLLLVLLCLLALIPIVATSRFSDEMHIFTLWIISISLLFHTSLVSPYLSNFGDAASASYYSRLVISNGFWEVNYPEMDNSLLTAVILPPLYSILLNVDLTWFNKIFYPILYSFLPVVTYLIYSSQISRKIAFLSSCYLMFIFSYYTVMQLNIRNGLAELFLALFALSLLKESSNKTENIFLAIVFAFSLSVSHHGTAYIFLFVILFSALLLIMLVKLLNSSDITIQQVILPHFSPLILIFQLAWYLYTSRYSGFEVLVRFLNSVITQLSIEILSTEQIPLGSELAFSMTITKFLIFISLFFLAIGIFDLIYQMIIKRLTQLYIEYCTLSIAFFLILMSTFIRITQSFSLVRVGHISLIFLAPFCILGFIKFFGALSKLFQNQKFTLNSQHFYKSFSIFLAVLLLFSSGVISETVLRDGDYSPEKLIHKPRLYEISSPSFIYDFYRGYFSEWDVFGARWLFENGGNIHIIYADAFGVQPLSIYWSERVFRLLQITPGIENPSYFYLCYLNVVEEISIEKENFTISSMHNIKENLTMLNKIYENGGSVIYYLEK